MVHIRRLSPNDPACQERLKAINALKDASTGYAKTKSALLRRSIVRRFGSLSRLDLLTCLRRHAIRWRTGPPYFGQPASSGRTIALRRQSELSGATHRLNSPHAIYPRILEAFKCVMLGWATDSATTQHARVCQPNATPEARRLLLLRLPPLA